MSRGEGPVVEIEGERYVDVNAVLDVPSRDSRWIDVRRDGERIRSLIEGPAYSPEDGDLYVVDVPWGRLIRVRDQAPTVVFEYEGEPNGLAFHPDGRLFVADFRRGILTFDLVAGSMHTVCDSHRLVPFVGVNDLAFDTGGNLYFTDQGLSDLWKPYGALCRLTPAGGVERLVEGLAGPNGVAVDHSGRTVFVSLTGDNSVLRVRLRPDGQVHAVSKFLRLQGGVGPDGMTVDGDGNLLVAHPGRGVVWMYSPHGELLACIRSTAGRHVTNVTSIPDRTDEFVVTEAEEGVLLRVSTDAVVNSHR